MTGVIPFNLINPTPRHEIVHLQIMQIKNDIMERSLELGRLLKEARDNNYNLPWGYARFGLWVESSGLDLSERQAYYLIAIVERSEQLGIPDEELKRVKLSKLKAILSLPADTDPDRVRELVREAETMSLKDVNAVVGALKNQEFIYKTHKFPIEVMDNIYEPAVERARRLHGNTVNEAGEVTEISDSKAVELWAVEFLNGPEEDEYPVIEAEFQDIVATEEPTDRTTAA